MPQYKVSFLYIYCYCCCLLLLQSLQELVKFATYILGKFFKLTETNPKIFMEALFWKSTRDAIDLEEGYESYKDDGTKM